MAAIITRSTSGGGATVKNAPLTNTEVDQNFINLNLDIANVGSTVNVVAGEDLQLNSPIVLNELGKAIIAKNTIGANTVLSTGDNQTGILETAIYDNISGKVIVIGRFPSYSSGYPQVFLATISGGTVDFGSPTTLITHDAIEHVRGCIDESNGKLVVGYRRTGSTAPGTYFILGTISGNSISFGSPLQIPDVFGGDIALVYNSSISKVIAFYDQRAAVINTAGSLPTLDSSITNTNIPSGFHSYSPVYLPSTPSFVWTTSTASSVSYLSALNTTSLSAETPSPLAIESSAQRTVLKSYKDSRLITFTTVTSPSPRLNIKLWDSQYDIIDFKFTDFSPIGFSVDYDTSTDQFLISTAVSYILIKIVNSNSIKIQKIQKSLLNTGVSLNNTFTVYNNQLKQFLIFGSASTKRIAKTFKTVDFTKFIGFSSGVYTADSNSVIKTNGNSITTTGLTQSNEYYLDLEGNLSETVDYPFLSVGRAVDTTKFLINFDTAYSSNYNISVIEQYNNPSWINSLAESKVLPSQTGQAGKVLSTDGAKTSWTTPLAPSSLNASVLTSGTVSGDRGVSAGSGASSFVEYNGLTKTSGQFDGGGIAPTNTVRLNYDGYLYATRFYGDGSQLSNLSTSSFGSSAANTILASPNGGSGTPTFRSLVQGDITSSVLGTGTANSTTFLRGDRTWAVVSLPSGQTAGSSTSGYLQYSGTTSTAGQIDGGTTAPSATTRLNYNGNFYATNFFGNGSNLTGISVSTINNGTLSGTVDISGSVRSTIQAVAALNIDCSTGNYFTKTISANSTFTVSNVPASRAYAFVLELTHISGSITWFSGVQWPENNAAPTLITGKVHIFVFLTDDGGNTWRGSFQANYNS